MKKLGIITIGESPRNDILPIFKDKLKDTSIEQIGVLDGLTKQEAERKFGYTEDEDYLLTSRFVNGDSILMSREKIEPKIQESIYELEDRDISLILILCTGVFKNLTSGKAILIEPEKIIPNVIGDIITNKKLGIIGPVKKQEKKLIEKWSDFKTEVHYESVSPYSFNLSEFEEAAKRLEDTGVELILLDCMGYSNEMKEYAHYGANKTSIILSVSLIASIISEFY